MLGEFIDIYEKLYRESSGYRDYQLTPSSADNKMIDKFFVVMNSYHTSFGRDTMAEYLRYQFNRWRGRKTRFGVGVVMLNWIIGAKAIKRWQEDHNKFIKNKYSRAECASFRDADDSFHDSMIEPFYDFSGVEEEDKRFLYGTMEGFHHCLSTTTLYNPSSASCLNCQFRTDCLGVLKNKYVELYRRRIKES